MVGHCANPDCRRDLHYLHDGKIYQFVLSPKTGSKRLLRLTSMCLFVRTSHIGHEHR
jgi:hypothetical protein